MPASTDMTFDRSRNAADAPHHSTADDRGAFIASARETLNDAVSAAIDTVKGHPRAAAVIAAGATAAVAGAAYGASRIGKAKPARRSASTGRTRAKSK